MAVAPIVAFLDSDDVYLPGRLSVPLKILADESDVVCVLSSARKFDRGVPRDARIPGLKLAAPAFEWALLAISFRWKQPASPCAAMRRWRPAAFVHGCD